MLLLIRGEGGAGQAGKGEEGDWIEVSSNGITYGKRKLIT